MATLRKFEIIRNFGTRPSGNVICNDGWCDVEIGQEYDLLQVLPNETDKYYNLGIPVGTTEEKAKEYALQIAQEIDEESIKLSNDFLKCIKEWGCD